MITPLSPDDIHGSKTIEGMSALNPAWRQKEIKRNYSLAPRANNGLTCPFTYYHIVDALLSIKPDTFFRAAEFIEVMLLSRPIAFDAVTTGRILGDIEESISLANGRSALLRTSRSWKGVEYAVSADPYLRRALELLLGDLLALTKEPRDKRSPLDRCPTVSTLV